jgi:hypothetical protein
MIYVFYDNTETQWELLGKHKTITDAERLKEYYTRKHKLPATRIYLMKRVG